MTPTLMTARPCATTCRVRRGPTARAHNAASTFSILRCESTLEPAIWGRCAASVTGRVAEAAILLSAAGPDRSGISGPGRTHAGGSSRLALMWCAYGVVICTGVVAVLLRWPKGWLLMDSE